MNVLFLCGRNKWRSPTAEQVFADWPGIVCASAGLNHDAECQLSAEMVAWADMIFVMETVHKTKLAARYKQYLKHARVICLGIADRYQYMDDALVLLLKTKVTPHLPAHSDIELN